MCPCEHGRYICRTHLREAVDTALRYLHLAHPADTITPEQAAVQIGGEIAQRGVHVGPAWLAALITEVDADATLSNTQLADEIYDRLGAEMPA